MRIRLMAAAGLASVAMLATAGTAAAADPVPVVGAAANSPGVLSGNVIQVPIHIPVNLCGTTVNVVALLNPAAANSCSNS
ncbi:chaplin [Streptomyces aureus]|uniref:chaplin n=1 Tax=Streptomyces aureus TaxID=193461 RepID=UPI00056CACA1|nr:chaplin [Streptomyces aureus]